MPTILLPLGGVVNTDATRAIIAFQTLANKLELGIKIPALLKDLQPLFVRFNMGGFGEDQKEQETQFVKSLIEVIERHIPEENKAKVPAEWKEVWAKEWKEAWNAMCLLDDRTAQILQLVASQSDIAFYFYSDTNPTHFAHIADFFEKCGVHPSSIFATFSYGNAIDKLLLDVMQKCHKEIENKDCFIVIGNPEQVKEPFLRNMAIQKKALILKTVQEKLKVIPLEEASLTVEVLRTILSQIKPSHQPPVLFSAQASAASSHQPLSVVTENDSVSTSISSEEDKKKLLGALP